MLFTSTCNHWVLNIISILGGSHTHTLDRCTSIYTFMKHVWALPLLDSLSLTHPYWTVGDAVLWTWGCNKWGFGNGSVSMVTNDVSELLNNSKANFSPLSSSRATYLNWIMFKWTLCRLIICVTTKIIMLWFWEASRDVWTSWHLTLCP